MLGEKKKEKYNMNETKKPQKLPNYYGILPANVRYNKNLVPNAKILYSELTALCDSTGFCWASNKYFAKLYDVDKITISGWINSLVKEGYIKSEVIRKKEEGTERKIYIIFNQDKGKDLPPYKGKDLTPQIKTLRHYNSTSINNTSSNNISKDIYDFRVNPTIMDGSKSPISENGIFHSNLTKRIVTRYNKEKNILCRVNIKKRTKVIENIEKNIRLLKEGKFQTKNRIDDKFRKLNNIPFEDKKYSITEIEEGFKNLVLMFDSSYHPINKPKGSLSSLIYNPVTKTSWLLEAIYNPPKPLKRQREFTPDFPEISDMFKKEFNTVTNDFKLNAGINSIDNFQKQIPEFALKQNVINREFGSLEAICKTYINWLKHQDWLEEVGVGLITAEGKMWKRFIEEYEKEVYGGFNLRSKKKNNTVKENNFLASGDDFYK